MTRPVTVEIGVRDGVVLVRVSGELDLASAPGIGEQIRGGLGEVGPRVVVDLSDVSYFDSSGVRMLDELTEAVERRAGSLRVVAPEGSPARAVLRICAFRADLLDEDVARALVS